MRSNIPRILIRARFEITISFHSLQHGGGGNRRRCRAKRSKPPSEHNARSSSTCVVCLYLFIKTAAGTCDIPLSKTDFLSNKEILSPRCDLIYETLRCDQIVTFLDGCGCLLWIPFWLLVLLLLCLLCILAFFLLVALILILFTTFVTHGVVPFRLKFPVLRYCVAINWRWGESNPRPNIMPGRHLRV